MNLVQIATNEFFPNSPLLNSREPSTTTRGRRCSPLSNSPFTQRYFPTGIRDGGRREPREPRFCSLGRKYVCRDLAAVGTLQQVQESPVRGSNGGALATASSLRFGRPIGAHRTRKNVDTQLHRQRLDELRVRGKFVHCLATGVAVLAPHLTAQAFCPMAFVLGSCASQADSRRVLGCNRS